MAASTKTEEAPPAAHISFERERGVYALEVLRDVAHAIIHVGEDVGKTSRILKVFTTLASANIPIFLIKMHRSTVTLAFAGSDTAIATEALLQEGLAPDVLSGLALVVVRAASMRDLHGIMVNIADSLAVAGARLYETGDSHNSVQCLIEEEYTAAAERELCGKFHLTTDAVHHYSVGIEAAG